MNRNVLIETSPIRKAQECPVCRERLVYIQKILTCPKCGDRFQEEDLRPESRLVSVSDKPAILIQPSKKAKEDPDIPAGARLIEESEAT